MHSEKLSAVERRNLYSALWHGMFLAHWGWQGSLVSFFLLGATVAGRAVGFSSMLLAFAPLMNARLMLDSIPYSVCPSRHSH